MAVRADEVMIGRFFATSGQYLRKVVRVATDEQRGTHVWFQHKSAITPNQPFLFGHTQDDPPTLEDFIAQCDRQLGWTELCELRQRGILLQHE